MILVPYCVYVSQQPAIGKGSILAAKSWKALEPRELEEEKEEEDETSPPFLPFPQIPSDNLLPSPI